MVISMLASQVMMHWKSLIENERKSGVYLTVLGYGTGNYQDAKMQKLADKGNGNHAYIDGISEAKKVLVNEFAGTMFHHRQRCKTADRIQSCEK
jgi:secreted protein with Ig-like and vWFA domain